jgi:putative two-component system response regulator
MTSTILIVDDSKIERQIIVKYLKSKKYNIFTAENGIEALEIMNTNKIDLVLTDIVMPEMDGIKLCMKLKNHTKFKFIPVLIMSSRTNEKYERIKALTVGADDLFTKPVEKFELLTRIKSLLKLKKYTDALENAENVIISLGLIIEARDPLTNGHCNRLAQLTVEIGKKMFLNKKKLKALELAGYMHDLGKICIPDNILFKPERLSDDEREIIKTHPVIGYDICKNMHSLEETNKIIRWHHEKLDGSGYPDGIKGELIPLTAQIMAVCDVYDALTNERPYKKSFSKEKAFQILEDEVKKNWWNENVLFHLKEIVMNEN